MGEHIKGVQLCWYNLSKTWYNVVKKNRVHILWDIIYLPVHQVPQAMVSWIIAVNAELWIHAAGFWKRHMNLQPELSVIYIYALR